MITNELTGNAQTTIPRPVRAAPDPREGDAIACAIEPGRVAMTRVSPARAADDPCRTFSERNGPADTEAYAGL